MVFALDGPHLFNIKQSTVLLATSEVGAMRHLTKAALIAAAILATNCVATAGSNTSGMTIMTDRDPDDFAVPKDTKYELNGAHTFDSGMILGSSFQYTDTTFSDSASQTFEGIIGYRVPLDSTFSLNGSAGIGEHWRENPSTHFPFTFYESEPTSSLTKPSPGTQFPTDSGMRLTVTIITTRRSSPLGSHSNSMARTRSR